MTRRDAENLAWKMADWVSEMADNAGAAISQKGVFEDIMDRLEASNDFEDDAE